MGKFPTRIVFDQHFGVIFFCEMLQRTEILIILIKAINDNIIKLHNVENIKVAGGVMEVMAN